MRQQSSEPTALHRCAGSTAHAAYGEAITECVENERGEFWVDNQEYASQVNYCPYCGAKARVPATEDQE